MNAHHNTAPLLKDGTYCGEEERTLTWTMKLTRQDNIQDGPIETNGEGALIWWGIVGESNKNLTVSSERIPQYCRPRQLQSNKVTP